MEKQVQVINKSLLNQLCQEAEGSIRRRKNYNFHQPEDPTHRLLNALLEESYVRPHRHSFAKKDEALLVLQGTAAAFIFEENGQIKQCILLDPTQGQWGIDIPSSFFHTAIPMEPKTVFYEVKSGPFDPATDKEWPAWAPAENDPLAKDYFNSLMQYAISTNMQKARAKSYGEQAPHTP